MNSLYKLEMNKLLSKKLIFLWLVLIICNLDARINGTLSSQQFIVDALSNYFYIINFMIPMFLLMFISSLDDDNEYILIRSKNYWNYFKSKIYAYGTFSIVFVLSQALIIAIMSIGLQSNNSFEGINPTVYKILDFFSNKFSTPSNLILYITSYMILGFFMISLVICTINNFFSKKTAIKIIIFIYLLSFSSIKILSLKFISFLIINTYIIFYHGFIFGFEIKINLVIEILFILIFCKINKDYWNKDISLNINNITISNIIKNTSKSSGVYRYHNKSLFSKYNILSIVFVLLIMSMWKLVSSNDNLSINKYLLNVFSGSSIGEFNPLIILEMLVFNLTPIYLLSVFIEQECNDRTIFLNIRLKTSLAWFKSIIKVSFKYILIYTVLSILIPICISILLGLSPETDLYRLIFTIFSIKLLNIIFEFLILFLIYSFTNNITMSFFSLIIFNLISIIPFEFIYYIPFGISSLCRYQFILNNYGINYGLNLKNVLLELSILIAIILIYLNSRHKKLIVK
ncbi:hypothetical protein CHF27_008750 [Romboutsia maritimum]|uniref:Uncharacterized protein n=1 Tax=Romboutsia maritimum TaxID=2020948 RepID=A0A371IS66_9FIRM|nr:hypothetical protein [Romboutsia maritimum]RDY23326.1 hypothetical protein CHF27_008750 [Romboutsia maritimum]